jgi:hypothetical protein
LAWRVSVGRNSSWSRVASGGSVSSVSAICPGRHCTPYRPSFTLASSIGHSYVTISNIPLRKRRMLTRSHVTPTCFFHSAWLPGTRRRSVGSETRYESFSIPAAPQASPVYQYTGLIGQLTDLGSVRVQPCRRLGGFDTPCQLRSKINHHQWCQQQHGAHREQAHPDGRSAAQQSHTGHHLDHHCDDVNVRGYHKANNIGAEVFADDYRQCNEIKENQKKHPQSDAKPKSKTKPTHAGIHSRKPAGQRQYLQEG